jgi:phospholipid transport system transporter-binding protein
MIAQLQWHSEDNMLTLSGDLDRETLMPLWENRQTLLAGKQYVNVAKVDRVDSAGLALLLHLCGESQQQGKILSLRGVSDRLRTLIQLYNLQGIIPVDTLS